MSSTRSPGLLLAFILCGRDSYKLSWRGVAWRGVPHYLTVVISVALVLLELVSGPN